MFHIEIITLNLFYGYDMGGLHFVAPPYERALADIRVLYPTLNVTQNIITNTNYYGCMDWMNVSDDLIAEYYFRHEDRWQRANLTVFLNSVADCDGHGPALLATNLRKFAISSSPAADIENKVKWPTRIETGGGGKSSMVSASKLFAGLLGHFNWTTVTIVVDAYRNSLFDIIAQIMRETMSSLLGSNIPLIKVDGFSPTTNYHSLLTELRKQTRVILYVVFGGTLRKFLIAARSLNMTQGDHVHICFRVHRNPLLGNFHWRYSDQYDEVAKEAYKSLLIAEPNPDIDVPPAGTEAYRLKNEWRLASVKRYNFSFSMTDPNIHLFPAYAMPLMVAQVSERMEGRLKVAPYFALNFSEPNLTVGQTVANELQTVNEFIEANQTELLKDGRNIARSFYNRTFMLRTGEFSFDQYGTTAGSDGIVGQYDEAGNLITVLRAFVPLRIIQNKPIVWPGEVWPVPNQPLCGYDEQDPICWPEHKSSLDISVSVAVVVLCCALLVVYIGIQASVRRRTELWWGILQEELLEATVRKAEHNYCANQD